MILIYFSLVVLCMTLCLRTLCVLLCAGYWWITGFQTDILKKKVASRPSFNQVSVPLISGFFVSLPYPLLFLILSN